MLVQSGQSNKMKRNDEENPSAHVVRVFIDVDESLGGVIAVLSNENSLEHGHSHCCVHSASGGGINMHQ